MDQVKNNGFNKPRTNDAEPIPHTPEEDFVALIYRSLDEAAGRELLLLRKKTGTIPTCKRGCYECCNQYVLISRREAHGLGQYIRRQFSSAEIEELRYRTLQWHHWNDNRPKNHPNTWPGRPKRPDVTRPFCPLLVKGSCSAYPMRPATCRTHFVCSVPAFCRFSDHPAGPKSRPTSLPSVVVATNRFSNRLKDSINTNGSDATRGIMLLPHWLAIEMRWDFAVAI